MSSKLPWMQSWPAGLADPMSSRLPWARTWPAGPIECLVDSRERGPAWPAQASECLVEVRGRWPAQPGECPVGGLPVDAGLAGPARRPRSQANMLSANAKFLKLACERKLEAARHLGTQSQAVLVRATIFRNRCPAPATQLKMRSSSKAINIERI